MARSRLQTLAAARCSRPLCWRCWSPLSPAAAGLILPEAGGGSRHADDIQTLYLIVLVIAVIVFIGVEGVLIYCLFKYRARKGRVAAQIHGNTRLEIGWTVGAAVILVFLTVATFVMLPGIKNPAASDIDIEGNPVASNAAVRRRPTRKPPPNGESMNIDVDGEQYVWRFVYPSIDEKKVYAFTDMYVPVGHDRDARHPVERRRALVVDPGARRQDGRAAGLHEQDVVQGDRAGRAGPASAPSCAGATTPTCTRTVIGAAVRRVAGLVRPAGGRHRGRREGRPAEERKQAPRTRGATESSGETGPTMAIAETTTAGAPRPQIITHEVRPEPTGWTSWITTTDHKRIGILYLWTVAVFFVLGGVEALLMRVQLGAPDNTLLTPESYNQLFTMHGTTMVFLVVVPVLGRLRELPAAADDRRARRRLPAPERVVVLDVPVRRPRALRVAVLHAAGGRLVLLRAALDEASTRRAAARTRGSTWSTSPASRRCSARSTSSRRSTTCARPAWAGAACRCSSGRS